jgi:uncharacterized membrane protein
MRYARVLFIIVILFCGFEAVRLWFLAPDVMAAHFNVQGNPDRLVPKLVFFGYQAQTVLVVIALSLVMQVLPMILPVQCINMPNREYWYAPERREATVDRLSSFAAALFALILLGIQAGFELAVSANLQKPIVFAAQIMVPVIITLFILSFMMLCWLARSFRFRS